MSSHSSKHATRRRAFLRDAVLAGAALQFSSTLLGPTSAQAQSITTTLSTIFTTTISNALPTTVSVSGVTTQATTVVTTGATSFITTLVTSGGTTNPSTTISFVPTFSDLFTSATLPVGDGGGGQPVAAPATLGLLAVGIAAMAGLSARMRARRDEAEVVTPASVASTTAKDATGDA
jgi:hypothetical protein